jgi:hypothetical protein
VDYTAKTKFQFISSYTKSWPYCPSLGSVAISLKSMVVQLNYPSYYATLSVYEITQVGQPNNKNSWFILTEKGRFIFINTTVVDCTYMLSVTKYQLQFGSSKQ